MCLLKLQTGNEEPVVVRQLEVAVHRAENRARLAEDRATRNDQLLNQKLIETSRLQGTLAQQSRVRLFGFIYTNYTFVVQPRKPIAYSVRATFLKVFISLIDLVSQPSKIICFTSGR